MSILGNFFPLHTFLLILQSIKSQGITATDALLVLDREQNGEQNLKKLGINLHW